MIKFNQEKAKYILDSGIDLNQLQDQRIFLIRKDGVLIYSNVSDMGLDQQSIGALLGGCWQAVMALADFLPKTESGYFRLSFDQSSKGVYILPLEYEDNDYILGLLFSHVTNPAVLKLKLRNLRLYVGNEIKLLEENKANEEDNNSKKDQFLFSDISDEEMNDLFSFSGK